MGRTARFTDAEKAQILADYETAKVEGRGAAFVKEHGLNTGAFVNWRRAGIQPKPQVEGITQSVGIPDTDELEVEDIIEDQVDELVVEEWPAGTFHLTLDGNELGILAALTFLTGTPDDELVLSMVTEAIGTFASHPGVVELLRARARYTGQGDR